MNDYCHVVTCWAHVPCPLHEHSHYHASSASHHFVPSQFEGTIAHPHCDHPSTHIPTQSDAAAAKHTAEQAADAAVTVIEKVVHEFELGLTNKGLGPNAEQEVIMHTQGHKRTNMEDSTQPLGSNTDLKAAILAETAQEAATIAKEITDRQFGVKPEEREAAEKAAIEVAKAAESVREAMAEAVAQAVAATPNTPNVMEEAVATAIAERTAATEAAADAFHAAADALREVARVSPNSQRAAAFAANTAVARAEQVVEEAKTGRRRDSDVIVEYADQAAQAAADVAAAAVAQIESVKFDADTLHAAEMIAALPEEVMHAVASAVANAEANDDRHSHLPADEVSVQPIPAM